MSKTELQHRCDNIRMQLDHFRATEQPGAYLETLTQLRILIRFTHNQRKRAAFQSILDEYSKGTSVATDVVV